MGTIPNKHLSERYKDELISVLTPHLLILRTTAAISQDELASFIGVSRQTYGAIERNSRRMSWNTYLSLIFFYDYNVKTHDLLRTLEIFPFELINGYGNSTGEQKHEITSIVGGEMQEIINAFDEKALHSVRTLIMLEYARCTGTSGEAVIKSFNGKSFTRHCAQDEKIGKVLKELKELYGETQH